MSGDRYKAEIAKWTDERLADLLELRYRLATTGPGNICERAPSTVDAYAPFYSPDYPYQANIGSFEYGVWQTLRNMPPEQLIHPNPYELSKVRRSTDGKKHYRIWDSAVAIPACSIRTSTVRPLQDIPSVRRCNTFYQQINAYNLKRVGPLGEDDKIIRPSGPFIFDLTKMERGWEIIEASHVLAHLTGDTKTHYRGFAEDMGQCAGHCQSHITNIVTGIAYDIPIDVSERNRGMKVEPDVFNGTEIKATTNIHSGVIRFPVVGGEAPRFDCTLSVMLHSVFIEPPPYGYTAMSGQWDINDRWCGLPTMIIVSGWEGIDVLMHQAFGTLVDKPDAPIDYVMPVNDLLPPETYWGYLALDNIANGNPITNERWQYFWDWLETPEYKRLLAQTPTLPCWDCIRFNRRSEFSPKRPPGAWPTGAMSKWPRVWKEYREQCKQIYDLVEHATEEYEAMRYGSRKVSDDIRKQRNRGHATKMASIQNADYDSNARESFFGIQKHRGMHGTKYYDSLRRQGLIV